MIPLEFIVPKAVQQHVFKSTTLPGSQEFIIPFAVVQMTEWTYNGQNYILQQTYENGESVISLITIQIADYTRIQVKCHQATTALQYTLKGNCFAYLKGYGCLPLFQDTYTLQYIPEGEHLVLFVPGIYQYLYINSGSLIGSLAEHDEGIGKVIKQYKSSHESGELAARLPFDRIVIECLFRLNNLPIGIAQIPFAVSKIINDLIYHYYEQLHYLNFVDHERSLTSRLNAYIANHIELTVRQIIKGLREELFIENRSLFNYWKKSNSLNLMNSLKSLRMHFGLFLLVVEKLPIGEVARRLNYSDPFVFSRLFNRFYKISPKSAEKIVI